MEWGWSACSRALHKALGKLAIWGAAVRKTSWRANYAQDLPAVTRPATRPGAVQMSKDWLDVHQAAQISKMARDVVAHQHPKLVLADASQKISANCLLA